MNPHLVNMANKQHSATYPSYELTFSSQVSSINSLRSQQPVLVEEQSVTCILSVLCYFRVDPGVCTKS